MKTINRLADCQNEIERQIGRDVQCNRIKDWPTEELKPTHAVADGLLETERADGWLEKEMLKPLLDTMCKDLTELQRERSWHLQSRIMVENRLRSRVAAVVLRYTSSAAETERRKKFWDASKLIVSMRCGKADPNSCSALVRATGTIIDYYNTQIKTLEKTMLRIARKLPVATWIAESEQKGIGLHLFAVIIGETGNLSNYDCPSKVWRRLGCAPWQFQGQTKQGSTWRRDGGLPASEWEEYGYSPRRRSVAYLVGECIVKHNESIYKTRYLDAKVKARETHPEWKWRPCKKCLALGDCRTCGGTGEVCGHAHNHGMLLASKLFLKNLWIEWNGRPKDKLKPT
jgi:hypothetical protein